MLILIRYLFQYSDVRYSDSIDVVAITRSAARDKSIVELGCFVQESILSNMTNDVMKGNADEVNLWFQLLSLDRNDSATCYIVSRRESYVEQMAFTAA